MHHKLPHHFIYYSLILLVLFMTWCSVGYAQSLPSFGNQVSGSVSHILKPTHPKPYDEVTLELRSSLYDLDRATITWIANGETIASGIGRTSISVTLGGADSDMLVSYTAQTEGGTVFSDAIDIRPQMLSLIWEANTYTPPFYKGKSLHSKGSNITFTAIPEYRVNGVLLDPSEFIYTWRVQYAKMEDLSGYGKNSITIPPSNPFNSYELSVDVESRDRGYSATETVRVPVADSFLRFYEFKSLYGVAYQSAQTTFKLEEEELSVVAEPYFMPVAQRSDPALAYAWKLDNSNITANGFITFSNTDDTSGISRANLTLTHPYYVLQRLEGSLVLEY